MVFTPQKLDRVLQQRRASGPEKTIGEEGVLWDITLNTKQYFLKQWRRHHRRFDSFNYRPESELSATSPYWHKLKKHEYDLIHAAVPEAVVHVAASYDPRLRKDSGQWTVEKLGRPVTITPAVVASHNDKSQGELTERRNAIIEQTYRDLQQQMVGDDEAKEIRNPNVDNFIIYDIGLRTDRSMRELLVMDPFPPLDYTNLKASWKNCIATVRASDSLRIFLPFLESGILPIHPEFNFIPTDTTDGHIKGIVLEAMIFDPVKLSRVLRQRRPQAAREIRRKMERYLLLRQLDEIFDYYYTELLNFNSHELSGWNRKILNDPDSQTRLFGILEAVRQQVELHGYTAGQALVKLVNQDLSRLPLFQIEAVTAELQKIKAWKPSVVSKRKSK